MEFPQKLIDSLLGLFEVKGKSTTNGVKIQQVSKEDQVQCEKEMHSKFRTAIGKLLWMSQLRDDIKFPVKELSRSLINPQDVDFDNLIHLLQYVNQTRDYVYVMEPQIPTADSQGLIPVEVVVIQIQIGQDVKDQEDQPVVHSSRCSQSICLQQAAHRLQYLTEVQKQNCMQ